MAQAKWTNYDKQLHAITNALIDLAMKPEVVALAKREIREMHVSLQKIRDAVPAKTKGE